jgi:hypothetical protein
MDRNYELDRQPCRLGHFASSLSALR